MNDILDINELKQKLLQFAADRNWQQFHTPKNLAMAATAEAGELLEIFQWMKDAESLTARHDPEIHQQTRHEIADVFLYLIQLAEVMGININEAINEKIKLNELKYEI